ncbi:hypothetical protein ACYZTL_04840 [Pseudomonas sp. LB3P81]
MDLIHLVQQSTPGGIAHEYLDRLGPYAVELAQALFKRLAILAGLADTANLGGPVVRFLNFEKTLPRKFVFSSAHARLYDD